MGFMDWLKSVFGGAQEAAKSAAGQAQSAMGGGNGAAAQAAAPAPEPDEVDDDDADDEMQVIRSVPGADLIDDDGERLWTSRHDDDIPVDQWQDVWGPLGGKTPDALATFFYHEYEFNELQEGDPDAAEAKLKELGYAHVGEFFAVRLTVLKHWGTRHGPNLGDAVFDSQEVTSAAMKGQRMRLDKQTEAKMQANPELFAPIEGISMEQYAELSAKQAQGMDQASFQALLGQYGLDMAAFQRVQAGWNDRMSKDTDGSLSTIYAKAFQGAGQGQFGAAGQAHAATGYDGSAAGGAEPIPFEKACEIQGAMSAWAKTGQDVNALLQSHFKMNAADWASANSWWMSQLAADVARFDEYNSKVEHYEKHYGGGAGAGADSDIEF